MKRAFSIFASLAILGLTAGCVHGQQPVTPPVITYTCPTPGNGAYALLAPPSSSTTYTATGVSAQTCYIAQGVLPGILLKPARGRTWQGLQSAGQRGKWLSVSLARQAQERPAWASSGSSQRHRLRQ